jgi:hypothetical protein
MYSDSLAGLLVDQSRQSLRYDALMPHRVKKILLVASLYDTYTFVEDGGVNDLLFSEYSELNLRYSPVIDRVSTARRALENLQTTEYDLVISMLRIGAMNIREFGARVKEAQPDLPVLLLAYNSRELSLLDDLGKLPGIDRVFVWSGDTRLFAAMVMYAEDKRNALHDAEKAGVQSILLIENSVHFYSRYLPLLYMEILRQTEALLGDGLNEAQRIRRMRARPKVLLATDYEEGLEVFDQYKDYLLGTILDASFPRRGREYSQAGIDFAAMIKRDSMDRAVLIQSSDEENRILAASLFSSFINKQSPGLPMEIRSFMKSELGFGDFIFRRADRTEVASASDLRGFCAALERIPDDCLLQHAKRNDFSTWLRARTEFEAASAFREKHPEQFESVRAFRAHIVSMLRRHQSQSRAGIVSEFSDGTFEGVSGFFKIGSDSLGGKGRGLAFLNSLIERYRISDQIPGVRILIPPTVVLSTDIFQQFVQENNLSARLRGDLSDEEICRIVLNGGMRGDILQSLRTFLSRVHYPLAVRSSSLLEDSSHQPLAGVYHTVMIPNSNPDADVRLFELTNAIKLVYASTFESDARSYIGRTVNRFEEEKMAVVIQQVVGRRHERYFYPDIGGVARSHNFYPIQDMRASDGVMCPVLGLGKTAVEGRRCLRFSPASPKSTYEAMTPRDYLNNAQRDFFALDLMSGGPIGDEAPIYEGPVRLNLDIAHEHGVFAEMGSVYNPKDRAVRSDPDSAGIKLVTMAPLLGVEDSRLADAVSFVLKVGEAGMSCPVEVEFAANLHMDRERLLELSLLQIRPMVIDRSSERIEVKHIDRDNAVCASSQALGHGVFSSIRDIVYVRQETFNRAATQKIADEIGNINVGGALAGRPFILIGPGRWGSTDPNLGIPVSWSQISMVSCIVETPLTDIRVSPSQGSHFFQNITSFGIGYFTINSDDPESFLNAAWLSAQPAATETPHIRHIIFFEPLDVFVDSLTGKGAVMKPGVHLPRREA